LEQGIEVFTAQQLHHEPRHSGGVVDACRDHLDDVIALDAGADAGFLDEAFSQRRVAHQVGVHDLQGAFPARADLFDDEDSAHAPLIEGAHEAEVPGEDLANLELSRHPRHGGDYGTRWSHGGVLVDGHEVESARGGGGRAPGGQLQFWDLTEVPADRLGASTSLKGIDWHHQMPQFSCNCR